MSWPRRAAQSERAREKESVGGRCALSGNMCAEDEEGERECVCARCTSGGSLTLAAREGEEEGGLRRGGPARKSSPRGSAEAYDRFACMRGVEGEREREAMRLCVDWATF